jgi:hypothetical protein
MNIAQLVDYCNFIIIIITTPIICYDSNIIVPMTTIIKVKLSL